MLPVSQSSTEAFFLDTNNGRRFCLFHAVSADVKCLGALLYVAPFAEEMNKSRRMLAILAKNLAQHGVAVLVLDLYGCGDSDGELKDASWVQWKNDLGAAFSWLSRRCEAPISLLGLRLGGLLALDFLRDSSRDIAQLVLWQPVINGQQYLTQFFRLKLASDILSDKNEQRGSAQTIRQQLNDGEIVEIAGYEISSNISSSIDALNATDFLPLNIPVHWYEIQLDAKTTLAPAKQKIIDHWRRHQVELILEQISGVDFWMTQEISLCEELVVHTTALLTQGR